MYIEYLQLDETEHLVGKCQAADSLRELVEQMLKARALTFADELRREGLLYEFLAELARGAEQCNEDVEESQEEYPKRRKNCKCNSAFKKMIFSIHKVKMTMFF